MDGRVLHPCSECQACAYAGVPGREVLAVLLYQDLPSRPAWAQGLAYDVTLAKPSRRVEVALDRPSTHHVHGRTTRDSSTLAQRMSDGKEPETMQAVRAIRKNQTTRKDLGPKFPAEFRAARSYIDLGLSDMRQDAPVEWDSSSCRKPVA